MNYFIYWHTYLKHASYIEPIITKSIMLLSTTVFSQTNKKQQQKQKQNKTKQNKTKTKHKSETNFVLLGAF